MARRASKRALSEAGRVLVSATVNTGSNGGKARAKKLSPERRREIARMGGLARHGLLKRKMA